MSEDDPEQRIRDLERPPADPAAATEAVALPDRQSAGMRVGWIVLSLLIIGLVIGGGYLIAERVTTRGSAVTGTPTTEVIAGGGGSFSAAPPPPAVARPGGAISVAGIDKDETHACDDSIVSVSGVHNHVVLTGHCARVDISGIRNTVIIDAADAIVVSGMNNRARFHSGSPEVSQSGIDNTLERG